MPMAKWGKDWLSGGFMQARFVKPIYDGDQATVTAEEAEGFEEGEHFLNVVPYSFDVSVMDTYALWQSVDGCPSPSVSQLPDTANDGTTTTVHAARPCTDGSAALLYVVNGGGHTWPGGEQYLPVFLVGRTSRDFDASETIWQFFASV